MHYMSKSVIRKINRGSVGMTRHDIEEVKANKFEQSQTDSFFNSDNDAPGNKKVFEILTTTASYED
jgi:hypothetical protein